MSLKKSFVLYIVSGAVLAVMIAVGLSRPRPVFVTGATHILMGTTVSITAIADDEDIAREAINKAIRQISEIEERLSYYNGQSELSVLNAQAYKQPVQVSRELYTLVEKSIEFNRLTAGAFDCTVAPMLELWREAAETGIKPTESGLREAEEKVGSDKLILNESDTSIRFAREGMRIDLGGIAKGYAIDKAVETMIESGATGGLVDAGGDIRCFGTAPEGKSGWNIGLQNPQTDQAENIILRFVINDTAITTSGDYYRFVSLDGERINHIFDPVSKTSARQLRSVSVIAPDALTADALSTAVTVLGKDKGKSLIETLPDVEAIIISADGQITRTRGIGNYLQ
jgi:FAD:protein FMN transferase